MPLDSEVLQPFWRNLQHAATGILLLDYDGTLAPFRSDRTRAVPYEGISERVEGLSAAGNRVVIISGRPAADIVTLFPVAGKLEIWGSHGCEQRLPDGTLHREQLSQRQRTGLQKIEQLARAILPPQAIEQKPFSLALHSRSSSPEAWERFRQQFKAEGEASVREHELSASTFDGGIEVRLPGIDKGDAVHSVLQSGGDSPAVAYLGDDDTDEDAFRALRGRGLPILVRTTWRPTEAELWLVPPEELLHFLDTWADCAQKSD
ncbi:MAG: trehalose-phosphatase [Synergistales bacterium]|nr:trehalose-phosphatase [Synergistales bacterium]